MICTTTSELYRETLGLLCDVISSRSYYSGSICFTSGDVECRLMTSVIVYRHSLHAPEGKSNPVSGLMPVWWEFHTTVDGVERLNDFSFSEMKTYL